MGIALTLKEVREAHEHFLSTPMPKDTLMTEVLRQVIESVGISSLTTWLKDRRLKSLEEE